MDEKKPAYSRPRSEVTEHKIEETVRILKPVPRSARAEELESLEVEVDSVVATMTLTYKPSHRKITINWADPDEDYQSSAPIHVNGPIQPPPVLGSNPPDLPPNTLRIQHHYKGIGESARFRPLVQVTIEDKDGEKTFDWWSGDLYPRYNFTFFPLRLKFHENLDSIFETLSELDVFLSFGHEGEIVFREWWKDSIQLGASPGEGLIYPVTWVLDGSQFSHEIEYREEPINHRLIVTENDNVLKELYEGAKTFTEIMSFAFPLNPVGALIGVVLKYGFGIDVKTIIAEFDSSVTVPFQGFHPRHHIGFDLYEYDIQEEDGQVTVHYKTNMELIVPLDSDSDIGPGHSL